MKYLEAMISVKLCNIYHTYTNLKAYVQTDFIKI